MLNIQATPLSYKLYFNLVGRDKTRQCTKFEALQFLEIESRISQISQRSRDLGHTLFRGHLFSGEFF